MLKDIIIGLSVGMVVGAMAVRKYKPCADVTDKVSEAISDGAKELKKMGRDKIKQKLKSE